MKLTPLISPSLPTVLVDDWVNITVLPAEKLGPSLKNALTGVMKGAAPSPIEFVSWIARFEFALKKADLHNLHIQQEY